MGILSVKKSNMHCWFWFGGRKKFRHLLGIIKVSMGFKWKEVSIFKHSDEWPFSFRVKFCLTLGWGWLKFPWAVLESHWPFLIIISHFSRPIFLGYHRTDCHRSYCLRYSLIFSIIYKRHPSLISSTFLELITSADGNLICFAWLLLALLLEGGSLKKKMLFIFFI